jgi:hypothetical protein
MATARPFDYGRRDYIDRMNDLYNSGLPRVRSDPADPDSPAVDVTASRQMRLGDNGCCADCRGATITISFHPECLVDGFSVFVNVVSGSTVSVNPVATGGVTWVDATNSTAPKSIAVGNAAIISSNGIGFRIFRMTAT